MKTKFNIATLGLLLAMLISACTPATTAQSASQPSAPIVQPSSPPTAVSLPTSAPVTATAQPIDRAATQQALMRNADQMVEATAAAASTGPTHFSGGVVRHDDL